MERLLHVIFCLYFSLIVVLSEELKKQVRETKYGKINGKLTNRISRTDVEEYLGIPYASPPTGKLRFKRPENPDKWSPAILDTMTIKPACPTYNFHYIHVHKPDFNTTSEDCLYMNIYVPQVEEQKLPILLFIHGGDNADGMGAMFDGDILAAHGRIIVITINYRVGVLGFYANPKEGIPGNNGLYDQVKAMKWIQENIHFFNGDPSKVTIHGHSAGAGDVGLHIISNLTKGLFKYAIVHSGSPLAHWMMSKCVCNSRQPSISSDCKAGTSAPDQNVTESIRELVNGSTIQEFFDSIIYGEDVFRVVVDGEYLTDVPDKLFVDGNIHAESVLFVMARDEGFEPRVSEVEMYYKYKNLTTLMNTMTPLFPETSDFKNNLREVYNDWKENNISSYPHVLHMIADLHFFIPMIKLADMISKLMKGVYVLSYQYISEDLNAPDWIGVQHGWDLFYVFGEPLVGHPSFTYTERDAKVSKDTMQLFSNYVKFGYLTLDGKERLPTYNSTLKSYNKLDYINGTTTIIPDVGFREERIKFWYKYLFAYDVFSCTKSAGIRNVMFIYPIILYVIINYLLI